MMNDDMLRNIDYLREKADVSYEEAATLLERYDGNVMRVLVELERQGRVYQHGAQAGPADPYSQKKNTGSGKSETREKATGFINKAFQHHIVVESGTGENKKTIANLSAPFVAGAAIVAPHLAAASVALAFVCGYRVKLKKEKPVNVVPEDVETFVDKTVSNIKQTASSLSETVRGEYQSQNNAVHTNPPVDPDENDEGGEITIE